MVNYIPERIRIDCGVFSLWKDHEQDIIWIDTDGQGVYAMTKDEYTFNGIDLSELPIEKKHPVRTVYADKDNNLWIGTKDNGIIYIKDYKSQNYSKELNFKYNDGLGTDIPAHSIAIQVLPPWYSSIYARILYGILIIGAIWHCFSS